MGIQAIAVICSRGLYAHTHHHLVHSALKPGALVLNVLLFRDENKVCGGVSDDYD